MNCSYGKKGTLVTGAHRSGTTWVGRLLSVNSEYYYVGEPFNPNQLWSPRTIMKSPFTRWFTYVTKDNEHLYLPYLNTTLGSSGHLSREINSIGSVRDIGRVFRRLAVSQVDRFFDRKPLMKDPIALFSAEWLAEKYDMNVVVMIRHPAAFVASIKRLGWRFDFNNLFSQKELMEGALQQFYNQIEEYSTNPPSLLEMAILQWRIAYTVVASYRISRPGWYFLRHEDLTMNPEREYIKLCNNLNIRWSHDMKKFLETTISSKNPVVSENALDIRRDTANIARTWEKILSPAEINLIKEKTESVFLKFYDENKW